MEIHHPDLIKDLNTAEHYIVVICEPEKGVPTPKKLYTKGLDSGVVTVLETLAKTVIEPCNP